MLWDDQAFLRAIDRGERLLAKGLSLILALVVVVASFQLLQQVWSDFLNSETTWLGDELTRVLGDVLNVLIALEVLQNLTAYLRRKVVQIELVLVTALTAVARKVIVLPPGAEDKPLLLAGLGLVVLALAAAYWLVRQPTVRSSFPQRGRARGFLGRDRSPRPDDDGGD
ncbi:phosphate-starvation-inducible PsiE family protein [Cyanobium sp. Morenito 9A2]|uniref:phosphate-starvation-inducible PsiE family protein n=1 Tax=Cyanobium sp. Morenito 9A2 TaxID=2823718 RepID=UPI0020CF2458|nr:phosphate-starvation-inducible PsiE family protein [Cyanobium sp. Morenito 9A2]MCP9848457.1 phosphate-starvation-inducible PsiE family protein [Cyanobium sp. Morenito 9A2]